MRITDEEINVLFESKEELPEIENLKKKSKFSL